MTHQEDQGPSTQKPGDKIVTIDVREDIRRGREPCETIMAAVGRLEPGDTLVLINSFEPVPLYQVMEQKGFTHRTERTAEGDWKIYFRRETGHVT